MWKASPFGTGNELRSSGQTAGPGVRPHLVPQGATRTPGSPAARAPCQNRSATHIRNDRRGRPLLPGRGRRGYGTGAMAKLYFNYSTMNAGKSTVLLQASHNYVERGMQTFLLTARFDDRAGTGRIESRIGIGADAATYDRGTDLFVVLQDRVAQGPCACVFVDEAQFLTPDQVWQLARAVDDLSLPIMCFGLRVDFRGELFPGSAALLALADEMREVRTICHCGKKATMVVRKGPDGQVLTDGAQVVIGGNETYESLCRRHWRQAVGQ
jgi:thymidine kinase